MDTVKRLPGVYSGLQHYNLQDEVPHAITNGAPTSLPIPGRIVEKPKGGHRLESSGITLVGGNRKGGLLVLVILSTIHVLGIIALCVGLSLVASERCTASTNSNNVHSFSWMSVLTCRFSRSTQTAYPATRSPNPTTSTVPGPKSDCSTLDTPYTACSAPVQFDISCSINFQGYDILGI